MSPVYRVSPTDRELPPCRTSHGSGAPIKVRYWLLEVLHEYIESIHGNIESIHEYIESIHGNIESIHE